MPVELSVPPSDNEAAVRCANMVVETLAAAARWEDDVLATPALAGAAAAVVEATA